MLMGTLGAQIAAEVGTGDDAVSVATRLQPDVAILDLRMPGLNGIAAARRIRESAPETAVILFSLSFDKQHILAALQAGVVACVAKQDGLDCLAKAVESARTGGHFLNPSVLSPSVLSELRESLASMFSSGAEQDLPALFDREASALFRCARVMGAGSRDAVNSLEESFLAYWMAHGCGSEIPNIRAWLLISVTSHLFSRRHAHPQPPPVRFLRLAHWYREMRPGHASVRALADYWEGAMPAAACSRLLEHVRRCSSCHLDWSLVAFLSQPASASPEPFAAPPGLLAEKREDLVRLLQTADVARFAIAWAHREIRVRELVATDLEVLLGSAAAREWRQPKGSVTMAPVAWTTEFLGRRTVPLALVNTSRPLS